MAIQPQIKEKIQEESSGKSLARLSKEMRRGTKQKKKLIKQVKKQKGEEKQETQEYIDTINEKLLLLLQSITPETIEKSNLASISKAFRSILGQRDAFVGKEKERDPNINIQVNIDKYTEEQVLERLNEISAGKEE